MVQLTFFFNAMRQIVLIESCDLHNNSNGGLLVTRVEMAFADHCGVSIAIDGLGDNAMVVLFNEELRAVI